MATLPAGGLEAVLRRDRLVVLASLAAAVVLAWLFLARLAGGMATMEGLAGRLMGMPAEDALSSLLALTMPPLAATFADAGVTYALVVLMWLVMMVGMMLPSAAPTILLFATLERKAPQPVVRFRPALFVFGYFLAWGAFSLAAGALQMSLYAAGQLTMRMAAANAFLAGGVFLLAGLFEFTPLKERCLRHCRSPLDWLPRHWRPGRGGALRMGAEHGAYCVGCCWALMLLLFAGGVMNLLWVAGLGALVLAQKLLPGGARLSRLAGGALAAVGILLIARPLLA